MRQMFGKYNMLILCTIGFLVLMIIGYSLYTKPSQMDITVKEVSMSIDSRELTASFQENEIFATSIYAEKVIEVQGVVQNISLANERVTVFMKSTENTPSILCDFSKMHQADALLLEKGDSIKVKGICKGFLKNVILLNCKLVKP